MFDSENNKRPLPSVVLPPRNVQQRPARGLDAKRKSRKNKGPSRDRAAARKNKKPDARYHPYNDASRANRGRGKNLYRGNGYSRGQGFRGGYRGRGFRGGRRARVVQSFPNRPSRGGGDDYRQPSDFRPNSRPLFPPIPKQNETPPPVRIESVQPRFSRMDNISDAVMVSREKFELRQLREKRDQWKIERDDLKAENAKLKKEIELLKIDHKKTVEDWMSKVRDQNAKIKEYDIERTVNKRLVKFYEDRETAAITNSETKASTLMQTVQDLIKSNQPIIQAKTKNGYLRFKVEPFA